MKHTCFKRLAALLFAVLLAVVALPMSAAAEKVDVPAAAGQDPLEYNYISVASNDWLELYTAVEGDFVGCFAVRNKQDGSVWYSSPLNARDDSVSIKVLQLLSLMNITVFDRESETLQNFTSNGDCVYENALSVRAIKNGLSFTFAFPALSISIPVDVVLDGSAVDVKIKVSEIEENGNFHLFDIDLLPYFCSGGIKDEGYLLVPDGSGALLNFNNGKTGYGAFSNNVYGGDAVIAPDFRTTETEEVCLPVYGAKRGDSAMLAIITEAETHTAVKATVSGVDSEQNTAWSTISLRRTSSYKVDRGWQGSSTATIYPDTPPEIDSACVRYIFLHGEDADLAGMAKACRQHFQKSNKMLTKTDAKAQVVVDVLGSVRKKTTFLGFPAWRDQELTSFKDAQTLAQNLTGAGVNDLSLRYLGWETSAVHGKIASTAKPLSLLGGRSDFNSLAAWAAQNNVGFYPDVNWMQYSKNKFALQQYFVAARNINDQLSTAFFYKRNLQNQDKDLPSFWFLNWKTIPKTVASFFGKFGKLNANSLSISGVGSTVYGDTFGDNPLSAHDAMIKMQELVAETAEKTDSLLTTAPHLYAAAQSDVVVDMPETSGFDMLDEAVPFYQMVLSGSVSYSGKAINLHDDPEKAFLTALATGSGLHYALTAQNGVDKLKNTAYEGWISCAADDWTDTISQQSTAMQQVYSLLGSSVLTDYEWETKTVSRSTFESGGQLLVNVGNADAVVDGVTVPARGYFVVKEGSNNG